MSQSHATSLPFPPAILAQRAVAIRQRTERGRKMILWGWAAAMLGVAGYCKAIFQLEASAEVLDAITRTGLLGWTSGVLLIGGVGLWLVGNLHYLQEVLDTPDTEPASQD